uniref:Retrotransposable element Tf2 n=1 Tax=Cajanus cajan TaxID=3821 RepID=A0A151TRC1_CAJCA|nr:Retrotransposable element Tf2 [Cajanus cajan]
MELSHPYIASEVAQTFMDHVFKLHGCPSSITSDRDPVFVSSFWQEFMAFQGIQVQLSSSYDPQTDGQSEIVNKCLKTYLRCMCANTPHQ